MAFSCAVIDLAAFGIEVDGERLFEVDGDLGTGLHINGSEGLAVELVDPARHVLDAAGENPAHGFLAADAHAADGAVGADIGRPATVGFDQRGHASPSRRDQRLGAEVLLLIAAPLAADTGNAVRVADPAQAVALLVVLLVALTILGDGADGPVMEHEGDAAHLAAHAGERPVARCGAGEHGPGHIGNVDAV